MNNTIVDQVACDPTREGARGYSVTCVTQHALDQAGEPLHKYDPCIILTTHHSPTGDILGKLSLGNAIRLHALLGEALHRMFEGEKDARDGRNKRKQAPPREAPTPRPEGQKPEVSRDGLATAVRRARTQKKLTATKVARALDMKYWRYMQIEYGKWTPPVSVVRQVAQVIGVPYDEIIQAAAAVPAPPPG